MDYESIFIKYQEEFTIENEEYDVKKTYKVVLERIRQLFFAIGIEKRTTHKNVKSLEIDLKLEKQYKEQEKTLWKTKYKSLPLGFDRKVMAYQEKEKLLGNYFLLINNLSDVLTNYYKGENTNKNPLTIIETLIEIITDMYEIDRKKFDLYLEKMEEDLENRKLPLLEHIGSYEELFHFILKILCNYEEFDFKGFQRAMLKKNSNV